MDTPRIHILIQDGMSEFVSGVPFVYTQTCGSYRLVSKTQKLGFSLFLDTGFHCLSLMPC